MGPWGDGGYAEGECPYAHLSYKQTQSCGRRGFLLSAEAVAQTVAEAMASAGLYKGQVPMADVWGRAPEYNTPQPALSEPAEVAVQVPAFADWGECEVGLPPKPAPDISGHMQGGGEKGPASPRPPPSQVTAVTRNQSCHTHPWFPF